MSTTLPLCKLSEIPKNGAKGCSIETASGHEKLFLIRKGTQVYGYYNRCPHTGVNLDWTPNQFLDISGKLIQCSTHGALFRIHDGFCEVGPCSGASLTAVKLQIHNEEIQLLL